MGHDVGGVVHGCIAQVKNDYNGELCNKIHKQDSAPKPKDPKGRAIVPCTGTVVKSCPNWHKTAVKFQRIKCTICLTSPDNHQEKKDHTCKTCACL